MKIEKMMKELQYLKKKGIKFHIEPQYNAHIKYKGRIGGFTINMNNEGWYSKKWYKNRAMEICKRNGMDEGIKSIEIVTTAYQICRGVRISTRTPRKPH